jgi:serine/threonine protein kinase
MDLINPYRVKQARNQETGEEVAIKILDKEKIKQEDLGESIKKEISFERRRR